MKTCNMIFPEDLKQFNELFSLYKSLVSEDADSAFEIARDALTLSDRWSELMLIAGKDADYSKTDLKNYCYHKYRTCQFIHEHCRMIWRQANEQALYFERQSK